MDESAGRRVNFLIDRRCDVNTIFFFRVSSRVIDHQRPLSVREVSRMDAGLRSE